MTKSRTDILAGLACIVVALVFYVQGIGLSPEADLYPKILEIFITVMGVFLMIRGGLTAKTSSQVEEVDFDRIKGVVIVIASVLYVAAIYYIGFYVSTFFFLALCSWYLSQKGLNIRAFSVSVGFGLFLTVLLYLLFTAILKVPTPEGILF
ncbi:MAG TPA: tripartite tricarboxylate transporter TctB family protein [Desulfitobacterium dehalogenans]|uniref:Tripartite tricarboxylate transporter TctB family protein n=1 Tax=Desulfitobacterium dehalogenans TaxID=36854 RepID=A0A7C6Z573_9FIRM|nr:tripartite tricarboxylate transporter TctB family protein [Desulfitobacterium dehalogenans]